MCVFKKRRKKEREEIARIQEELDSLRNAFSKRIEYLEEHVVMIEKLFDIKAVYSLDRDDDEYELAKSERKYLRKIGVNEYWIKEKV